MKIPDWLAALNEEDFQFLKRFVLASGSLKALAQEYGISYPTIRIRLDRMIAKIQAAEDSSAVDVFHRQLGILLADGGITPEAAKQLIQAHRQVMEIESEAKR
jgi:hypothetical protein